MRIGLTGIALGLALLALAPAASRAGAAEEAPGLRVDVPVRLTQAQVVFNLDHPAFAGDQPVGLEFMRLMVGRLRAGEAKWRIVAIFHGANGYMALGDATYARVRHWPDGNPYKGQIAALQAEGVEMEMCAETMRTNGWINTDLLPGIKVNSGANFRLIELLQQGFIEIHP